MSDVDQITKPAVDFDPDALREKYRQERDKRLRADGENQYVQMSGPLAQFVERDPHVEPGFVREPLTDEVDVVVGRCTAMARTDFRIGSSWDFRRTACPST
jgi:hypothetical protein